MTQVAEFLRELPWTSFVAGLIGAALLWIAARTFANRTRGIHQLPNWRFSLLVVTGIALSIASGWTTWEGMRNFTTEPLLSFLITFGIQAILLVVSWLIGESFANNAGLAPTVTGAPGPDGSGKSFAIFRTLATIALVTSAAVLLFAAYFQSELSEQWSPDLVKGVSTGAWFTFAFSLVATAAAVAVYTLRDRMVWAFHIIVANVTLWAMFIACLAASVFFSFDSLFSNIFPASERERVAELHTRARVAELVSQVRDTATERLARERSALHSGAAWRAYDSGLGQLRSLALEAPAVIRDATAENLREQQDKLGNLRSDQVAAAAALEQLERSMISARRTRDNHRAELTALSEARTALGDELTSIDKQIAAKTVEAEQEENGLGVTGTAGRGPKYREIVRSRQLLEFERRRVEIRIQAADKEIEAKQQAVATAQAVFLEASRQVAQQRARTETASSLLALGGGGNGTGRSITPSLVEASSASARLDKARAVFLQTPTPPNLEELSTSCVAVARTLGRLPSLSGKAQATNCTSPELQATTGTLAAMDASIARLDRSCTGSGSLPENVTVDRLVTFARDCIATAALPATETARLQDNVNRIALKRDDKAHRFVVTMNAFEDGNQLAYLALALALAIDGLVFAAGLFGAFAARSPLSAIAGNHGRSGHQLEAIVSSALLPDMATSARHILEHATPAQSHEIDPGDSGWTHTIDTATVLPAARRVIAKLLAAGASVGAVRQLPGDGHRHGIRRELVEYLATLTRSARLPDLADDRAADVMTALVTALAPDAEEKAARIRRYFTPMPREDGFMASVSLAGVEAGDRELVNLALNAGASLDCVKQHLPTDSQDGPATSFLIHKTMYQAMTALHAARLADRELLQTATPDRSTMDAAARTERPPARNGGANRFPAPEVKLTRTTARTSRPTASRAHPVTLEDGTETESASADARSSAQQYLLSQIDQVVPITQPIAATPEIAETARDIWNRLDRITANSPDLHEALWQKQRAAQEKLATAYGRLLQQSQQAGRDDHSAIYSARNAMERALPIILLQSEGGAVARLREVLAKRPEENTPLGHLLSGAPPLGPQSVEPWREFAERLEALG
jgi:hypothetical protein